MKSIHSRRSTRLRELLIAARKRARVTQSELGVRLRSDQSTISKIERGERRLDLIEFVDWCEALEVDPAAVLRGLRSRR